MYDLYVIMFVFVCLCMYVAVCLYVSSCECMQFSVYTYIHMQVHLYIDRYASA